MYILCFPPKRVFSKFWANNHSLKGDKVMHLTCQLQQQLQDSADQLYDAITKLETNIQVKK